MKHDEYRSIPGVAFLAVTLMTLLSTGVAAESTSAAHPALAAVSARVDELAAAGELSGVVLVAHDGEVLLEKAVGLARREPPNPNLPTTRFNIGSITKVFTHVMILQLEREGLLGLDEPIATYLPDYPDPDIASRVTPRQLLNMSSGLGDFFGERFEATPKNEILALSDYLKLFSGRPLEFEPGTSKRYSNAGFIVLGLIIEKLTGMPYQQALAVRVFGPAGMTGSALLDRQDLPGDAATGYTREGWMAAMQGGEAPTGEWMLNTDTLPGRGSSAGGSYSTARDLLAFDRALAAGTLCDPSFWRGHGGLGVAGGAPGVNGALESDWNTGWTLVVLSNLDPPSAMSAARSLRAILGMPGD